MQTIVERYLHHYNAFQISLMIELFTDNCLFQNISNGSIVIATHGKKELEKLAHQSKTLFSARSQTPTNWIITPDKIAVEIDFDASLAQDLPSGAKKGTTLKLKGVSIFEFHSGKISRLVDYS